jgi:putative membrane-bound dehydrogenase-like protein
MTANLRILFSSFTLLCGLAHAGPVSLFDGKTLDGWDFDPKIWRVENGVVTAGNGKDKVRENYFISTQKSYQNFELKLKIKCSGDPATGLINSGIQIRSERVPGGAHMIGYQVDCGAGWFGKIYDEFRRRKVIAEPVDAAALAKAVDIFGWNEYRIRAEGPRIQTWINGVLAIDYTETDPKIALDGRIGPQVHSGGATLVQFKDVTLEELPATPNMPIWESVGGVEAAMKPNPRAKRAAGKPGDPAAPAAPEPPEPPEPNTPEEPAAKKRQANPKAKATGSGRVGALTPAEQLAGFTVQPGFDIELVASEENGVINPIDLTFDDSGRLWTQTARMYPLDPFTGINFKEALRLMDDPEALAKNPKIAQIRDLYQLKTKGTDNILILTDPTKQAQGPLHVWADGLTIPQSILPHKDGAYVAHGEQLFFLRDTNGDGKSDKMDPVLSGFGFTDTHTMSHLLMRGPGRYIHFSQGALNKGMVTAVASGKQHRIDATCQVRFGLDHQDFEQLTAGPSNMWGLQLRSNGQWYGTEANDRGFSVIPYEHGTAIIGAAFRPIRPYQPLMPEVHKLRVGGTGISGLAFADDLAGSFPAEWKDVAILANPITSTINAVRIVRNANGTVTAEHLPDLLTSKDDWFRPVNIEFGPDGCLYIADFYNKIISHNEVSTDHPDRDRTHGRIWRIRHKSQPARIVPNVAKATPAELLKHLQAPSLWEKRAAWQQIGDRQLKEIAPALVAIVGNEKMDIVTRIHALWSLEEIGHYDTDLLTKLIAVTDDNLRREAVRSLATFTISPSEVAAKVQVALEDKNCMIRSQAIRTLSDLRKSDPAVIASLITACKPALEGNALGGTYERAFERFLARMALEKFPAELNQYLAASSTKHPAANVLWAIQALDDAAKKEAFLGIWSKVAGQEIDSETFVAITGMLSSQEVATAVRPLFNDPSKSERLVSLALMNQSRVQSPELVTMLTTAVRQLLETPSTLKLALGAISKLRMESLATDVSALKLTDPDTETLQLMLGAKAITPKPNAASFAEIAAEVKNPFDLRIEATHALMSVDANAAKEHAIRLLQGADSFAKSQMVNIFSQSKPGSAMLGSLFGTKLLAEDDFDLSAAERIAESQPKEPAAKQILAAARRRIETQRAQAQVRIAELATSIRQHPGDATKGKAIFTSCLACHKVGNEGIGIAPPLDGSGHRDLEHVLTALVDPDIAVEGGYGLYRITRNDGSVAEGLLEKEEPLGTTVAMMGGVRVFVPLAQIKKAGPVGGRSFMLPAFGQLPNETMADLIAYIATLKEGAPEAGGPKEKPAVERRAKK